jgi:hypothetical protein
MEVEKVLRDMLREKMRAEMRGYVRGYVDGYKDGFEDGAVFGYMLAKQEETQKLLESVNRYSKKSELVFC